VSGLAALMLSADNCFSGNLDAIESWIDTHARGLTTSEICGAFDGARLPNTTYGHGIIHAALPAPGQACDLPISGTAMGLSSGAVRCTDRSTGDDAMGPLIATTFDCDDAGLVTAPGDDILLTVSSPAFAGTFTGNVIGMTPARAVCHNRTSGQTVVARLTQRNRSWDCSANGFVAALGDPVLIEVSGTAD
jgi:hypothetical protein